MASNEGGTAPEASNKQDLVAIRRPQGTTDQSEVPFLVCQWLQHYNPNEGTSNGGEDAAAKRAALERVRKATSELASAFTALGAFGQTTVPSLSLTTTTTSSEAGVASTQQQKKNATYADVNRRWASALPGNHLNNLVEAAVSSTIAAEDVVHHCAESNLVDAANEAIVQQRRNPSSGRTVQDAIDLDKEENNLDESILVPEIKPSILHRPTRVGFKFQHGANQDDQGNDLGKPRNTTDTKKMPPLESQLKQLQSQSSQAMRKYLDLKAKFVAQTSEMNTLKSSLDLHSRNKEALQQSRLAAGASMETPDMEITEDEQNADRVLAQLQRKIGELQKTHDQTVKDLKSAKKEAYGKYNSTRDYLLAYRDPMRDATRQRPGFATSLKETQNQGILQAIESRRLGLQSRLTTKRALPKTEASMSNANHIRNALFESRLSHAVTINSHCHNPVYSVRFDRTGRYFITGADDNLIKVFQTRAKQAINSNGKGVLGQGQDQTIRGAVLVCTFRGHASVINEIDVSPDNCFLATASEDGDCRVWGLKDGSPVALLRGHVGGCNAVSWSKLTPYRLLTAGHDGFARCWDIRLAALKRYGAVVGKRPEYCLPLTPEEREANAELQSAQQHTGEASESVNLPPIPERQSESTGAGPPQGAAHQAPPPAAQALPPAAQAPPPIANQGESPSAHGAAAAALANQAPAAALPDLPPPPLPPPADQGPTLPDQAPLAPLPPPAAGGEAAAAGAQDQGAGAGAGANNIIAQPGIFILNDIMDEGVRLVGKFQHGTVTEEQIAGPATRSGRGKVKVLLFARCPLGGHFATGASDGTCRIWEDIDDPSVETIDRRFSKSSYDWIGNQVQLSKDRVSRRNSSSATDRLLLELKGFMNPTTDLQYSHAGDRILVGSMADGVLRIWSWDVDPSKGNGVPAGNDKGLKSILIKLTNPLKSGSTKTARRRARGGASTNNASKIELNMAVWTNDDSKIITSQSQPTTGLKIEPGSNFIFLWDSKTGHCLLGIADAHSRATPVILPHPTNPSIFISAGSDGNVKVFNAETGKCLFTHRNEHQLRYLIDATPQEPCGLLNDGAFFPDGTGFVLSDSTGNVLVFDSVLPASEHKSANPSLPSPPAWMKEQYRANDYYDLKYEVNGYCVEQGSNLPPHLAPRGARCTHSGAPFSDSITEAFNGLGGPGPLPIQEAQWYRECIRHKSRDRRQAKSLLGSKNRRGNVMQEYDPLTTVLVRVTGEVIPTRNEQGEVVPPTVLAQATSAAQMGIAPARRDSSEQRRSSAGRLLSQNFRWRDYTDMLREETVMDESSDEEFQPTARGRTTGRSNSGRSDSFEFESDEELDLDESPQRRPAQRSNQRPAQRSNQRPAQPRQQPTTRRNAEAEELRPSRTSNRRLAIERNRYQEEPDWDEEEEELVSTNNDPTGPHVEDYTKHFFRLPPNGPNIARKWLRRETSDAGYQGRKTYAPQVGDTVVYIPRSHLEWIEAYPGLKMPWQHWPPEAEWPVVCCCIRDIRYRFPLIEHYANRNTSRTPCNSIVAILSLEVTGIPVLDQDREFNWPDPHFIPPARSHLFELDLFESEFEEFVIPYDRYVWRLQCLEEVIRKKHGTTEGVEISAYYENEEDDSPDADLILYRGYLDDYAQRDHHYNDESLNNCGYSSIRIRWPENNQQDALSPWETIVERPKTTTYSLTRHCLDDQDKKRAREAIKNVKRIPMVREQLTLPVNERRYIDYTLRVEVPMCLDLVELRLENDYYTSRWSIVADVKLIRDNCMKYNGEVGLLQDEARQMFQEFEKEMLSEEERQVYNDLKTMVTANAPTRESTASRSSLENLPPPEPDEGSTRRRSLRIRIDTSNLPPAQATTGRALRSNTQAADFPTEAAHSASFANALQNSSRRQSRRRSNGSDSAAPQPRAQRGRSNVAAAPAAAAPAAEPARRRSSRMLERESQMDTANENRDTSNTQARAQFRRSSTTESPQRRRSSTTESPQRRRSSAAESPQRRRSSAVESPAATRQTRARRASAAAEQPEPESESESDAKPAARPTRSSSRLAAAEHHSESESEDSSESEPEETQQASRRSSRSRKPSANYEDEEHNPPPQNTRKRARDESDESEDEEDVSDEHESESEEESEVSTPPAKRPAATRRGSARNTATTNVSPARTASRRRSSSAAAAPSPSPASTQAQRRRSSRGGTGKVSYAEASESEFEEPSEDEMSEDEVPSPQRSGRARRAAAKKPASRKSPAKKKKPSKGKNGSKPKRATRKRKRDEFDSEEDESDIGETVTGPRPSSSRSRRPNPWQEIPQKDITYVTLEMLEYMRQMDDQNLFGAPVFEAFADIKHEYLEVIAHPMDFRTIEEERLNYYENIRELQNDLTLVFQNCIRFNGQLSEYGQYAQHMLDMMDDAFENIVASLQKKSTARR